MSVQIVKNKFRDFGDAFVTVQLRSGEFFTRDIFTKQVYIQLRRFIHGIRDTIGDGKRSANG